MRRGPSAGRTASAHAVKAPVTVLGPVVLVAAVVRGPLRSRCRRVVAAVLSDIATVRSRPRRAAALWCCSPSPRPALVRVAFLHLAATRAAAQLPTAGGCGSLNRALAFTLDAGARLPPPSSATGS
ncbi:hypothetical protein [Streptomyces cyslabdanicus]|uniref:hypothetical protein n=1 Tax=Streptomyces cyslabdanicus TaxID=1470456 RepID=UPI0040444F46